MFLPGSTTAAWHDMTAVGRRWRGRGVATTLKRATIAWAIAHGLELLETGNDDDNAPMRAVNLKLGYRPIPDMLTFRGPLAPEPEAAPGDGAYFGPWRRSTSTASGSATGSSRPPACSATARPSDG